MNAPAAGSVPCAACHFPVEAGEPAYVLRATNRFGSYAFVFHNAAYCRERAHARHARRRWGMALAAVRNLDPELVKPESVEVAV